MTAKKILSVSFVLLLFFNLSCKRTYDRQIHYFGDKERITVALDIEIPGYLTLEGDNFGLHHDLLQAYADEVGLELEILGKTTRLDRDRLFKIGKADMALSMSSYAGEGANHICVYETSFVMLANKREARRFKNSPSLTQRLDGKKILISSAFKRTKDYGTLLDSLVNADISVTSRGCVELLKSLRNGEYDYLICENSEARIGGSYVLGVTQVHDFAEKVGISIVLNSNVNGLKEDFSQWFSEFRATNEYSVIKNTYFKEGEFAKLRSLGKERISRKGISDYDKIMREICEREGFDWRFMSAIAYHESRFKPNVVSNKGARGLMQIMPSVARQFNVSQEDIIKPEINIELAAKLLAKIESSLRFSKGTSVEDRMSIILASYNCGIGHVLDARRLAAKYGGNPDSWQDVSLFLRRKSEPEYVDDAVVKCGRLGSGGSKETLAFVSNVIGKYNSYRSVVKR